MNAYPGAKRRRANVLALLLLGLAVAATAACSRKRRLPQASGQATAASARPAAASASAPAQSAIAIRNIGSRPVSYALEPWAEGQGRQARLLQPGAIDRFAADRPVVVHYETPAGSRAYSVSPGSSYLFRYSEAEGWDLFVGSHGRSDAPDLGAFVPTPAPVVNAMIERARLGPDDVLFDLGCGDGRIVIEAARRHGCRGVGIELDPALVEQSRQNARAAGVDRLVEFRVQDATKADFTTATVVMLYLLPESNALLRPVLERQLRPGARVLSHNYAIPGWDEKLVEDASLSEGGEMHYVYVYRR